MSKDTEPLVGKKFLASLLGGTLEGWKKSRWSKKRKVGHLEGVCKGARFNKTMLRLFKRSKGKGWGHGRTE